MRFHIITLFPNMFDSVFNESILAKAIKQKKIRINFINPRKFVSGKYKKIWPDGNISLQVDDRPYGGGPGMIIMAMPIIKAIEFVVKKIIKREKTKILVINFIPSAKNFTTTIAKNISKKYTDVIMICGHYEGIDTRINKILKNLPQVDKVKKISIGDFILTGGEIPAMVLIDSISRQVEGVLGNFDSREEERISTSEVYTRPETIEYKNKKYKVPKVLLSGNHKKIEEWKQKQK